MSKYEIAGSPTCGYRIWFMEGEGEIVDQASPPFHTPCEAKEWANLHGIDAKIAEPCECHNHDQ